MKQWLDRNKKMLIFFVIITIVAIVANIGIAYFLAGQVKQLEAYLTTGVVSRELQTIGIVLVVDAALLFTWIGTFMIVVFKVFIPDSQMLRGMFCVDELSYLSGLPTQIKKGLKK